MEGGSSTDSRVEHGDYRKIAICHTDQTHAIDRLELPVGTRAPATLVCSAETYKWRELSPLIVKGGVTRAELIEVGNTHVVISVSTLERAKEVRKVLTDLARSQNDGKLLTMHAS